MLRPRLWILLATAALAAGAHAQTAVSWTGAGDGTSWSDGANWDSGTAPTDGDDVRVARSGTYTIDVDETPSLASLTLAASGATLDLSASGFGLFWSVGALTVSAGTVVAADAFLDVARFEWSGGAFEGSGSIQTTSALEPVQIRGAGTLTLDGWNLELNTGAVVSATDPFDGVVLQLQNGATLTTYFEQTLQIASDNVLVVTTTPGDPGVLFNEGRVVKTEGAGASRLSNLRLTGAGTLDVLSGRLDVWLPDGASQQGGLAAASGALLYLQGASLDADLDLTNARVDVAGDLSVSGGTYRVGSQAFRVGGAFTVQGVPTACRVVFGPDASADVYFGDLFVYNVGAEVVYDAPSNATAPRARSLTTSSALLHLSVGGAVSGLAVERDASLQYGRIEGGLDVAGDLTWNRARLEDGVYAVAGDLTIPAPGPLDAATLVHTGASGTWESGIVSMINSSTIRFEGTMALTGTGGDLGVQRGSGAASVVNTGTLTVSATDNTEFFRTAFTNDGDLVLDGADLRFSGGYTSTAASTLSGNGAVGFASGTVANDGVVRPGGSGVSTLLFPNGYEADAGTLDVQLGGPDASDALAVTGTASLSGTLSATLVGGYTPAAGDEIVLLTADAVSGRFDATDLPEGLTLVYDATRVLVTAQAVGPPGGTYTWTGAGDGTSWSDGANWDSGFAPLDGQDVVIDLDGGANYTVVVDVDPDIASLRLTSGRASLDVAHTLDVAGLSVVASVVEGAGTFTTRDLDLTGFLSPAGTVRATGTTTWTGGSLSGEGLVAFEGPTTITAGGAYSGSAFRVYGGTLRLADTTTLTGYLDPRSGAVIEVPAGAELRLAADDTGIRPLSNAYGQPTLVNAGRIVKTGGDLSSLDSSFLGSDNNYNFPGRSMEVRNTGEIAAEAGEILLYAGTGSQLGGTLAVSASGAISLSDGANGSGGGNAPDVPVTATIQGAGRFTTYDAFRLTGRYDVTGSTVLSGGAAIAAEADLVHLGFLYGSGRVEPTGTYTVAGFRFGGYLEPDLVVTGDASVEGLSGPGGLDVAGALELSGTVGPGRDLVARGTLSFPDRSQFEGPPPYGGLLGRRLRLLGTGSIGGGTGFGGESRPGRFAIGEGGVFDIGSDAAFTLAEGGSIGPLAQVDGTTGEATLSFGEVVNRGRLLVEAGSTARRLGVPTANVEGAVLQVHDRLDVTARLTNRGTLAGTDTLALGDERDPGTGEVLSTGVLDNLGTVTPAFSTTGTFTVDGDYSNGTGTLAVGVDGPEAVDRLDVTGAATLSGTLDVRLGAGAMFTGEVVILTAASVTGRFDTESVPEGVEVVYEPTRVLLRAVLPPPDGPALAETAWPMLGHDARHTGRSPSAGPTFPAQAWFFESAFFQFFAQPVLGSDGALYVPSDNGVFYALNPDGTERWQVRDVESRVEGAVAEDGRVYVVSDYAFQGTLDAISSEGEVLWQTGFGEPIAEAAPLIGPDGTVYVGVGVGEAGQVAAVNADGSVRWQVAVGSTVTGAPALSADGRVLVGTEAGVLVAVDPSGDVAWQAELATEPLYGAAVDAEGTIYVGSRSTLTALPPAGGPLWQRTDVGAEPHPTLDDAGRVYAQGLDAASGSRSLVALDATTGETLWEALEGADEIQVTAAADDRLYVNRQPRGEGGTLYVYDRDGTSISDQRLPLTPYSAPVIDASGRVLVAGSGGIAAFAEGVGPILSVDPAALDFGPVAVGETVQRTVTLSNSGDANLVVDGVTITGGDAFSVALSEGSLPVTIGPSGSRDLVVSFTPRSPAPASATLSFDTNAAQPEPTVALRGSAEMENRPPVAVDDAATTDEDTAVTVAVLANDSDPDGDALTIVDVGSGDFGTTRIEGGAVVYTPGPDFNGTDVFPYTIADPAGATASASVTVTVRPVNDAPLAVDDAAATGTEAPVTIAVLANDSDPDGDALTLVDVGAGDFGTTRIDGETVVYTPGSGFAGTDVFPYTIADGNGGTASATVTVTVSDTAPIARDDAAATDEDAPVQIAVLANDESRASAPLAVVAVGEASRGSVTIDDGGTSVTYTPATDAVGTDRFSYTVRDAGGEATAIVTVTIRPVPDAPVAADDAYATGRGATLTVDAPGVLANDTDADGDALTASVVTGPANGTLTLAASGGFAYSPNAGFEGDDAFTYAASDGDLSDTATVTITVGGGNVAPVAVDDEATTDEDAPVTIAVLANDSDANSDPLVVVAVGDAARGTVTTDGQAVTYTPAADVNGTDAFTYTVSDGDLTATATVAVTIRPVNDAPLALDDEASTASGTAVTVAVLANDTDPDGDALVVAAVGTPSAGTVTTDGQEVVYTPPTGFSGTATFTYTASDGALTDLATVTITVAGANRAPVARADTVRVRPGDAVTIAVLANDTDPDGDALSVAAVQSPTTAGGTASVAEDGAAVRYVPPADFSGEDAFTYTVTDGALTADGRVVVIAQPFRFALTDLGTLGGDRSAAMAIDASGRVAGGADDADGTLRAVVWTDGVPAEVAVSPRAPGLAYALAGGYVVGVSYGDGETRGFRTGPSGSTLLISAGPMATAYGVDATGTAVGSVAQGSALRAVVWNEGAGSPEPTSLGAFGLAASEAFGRSPEGLTVGYAASEGEGYAFAGDARLDGPHGRAYAANASGVVVGSIGGDGGVLAVRWPAGGARQDLDGLGGGFAEAYAINAAGWIVGAATPTATDGASGRRAPDARGPHPLGGALMPAGGADARRPASSTRAVLWADGQTLDLDALVGAPGWTLLEARGVNAAGAIVGTGLVGGQPRAFLLTPTDNAAPTTQSDRAAATDGPVTVAPLDNDADADGDPLRLVAVLPAAHGAVEFVDDQHVRYTPTPGYAGEDRFRYVVADGRGGLAEGDVVVVVQPSLGASLALVGALPNPISGRGQVAFTLPEPAAGVRVEILDLLGRRVALLADRPFEAGAHRLSLDVANLAPGTYLCRVVAGATTATRPLVVVR